MRSGMFTSVNGDRKYTSTFFAEYFASFIGNGIFPNPSTNTQVIADSGTSVIVQEGKAWIDGYILYVDNPQSLTLDTGDNLLPRIDKVVIRLDKINREIVLAIKKGTPATNPTAPNLQRDGDMHELGIANIRVDKGASTITQSNITDLRLNGELCGIVHGTVDQVDTTTIFNQYQAWFNDITGGTEQEIADWQQQQYDDFMIWFQSIQDILEGDVAANLAGRISTLENDFDEHKAEKATQNKLGHVKVDGITIFANNEGCISLNPNLIIDPTGSPGPKALISGTMEEGFFGEVSSSELITGDALASECGISQGTSQHSTEPWLKFAYKGDIQFVAKKPIRHSISWDAINTAKCVYGDSGDKAVTIDGIAYKVTLMRATNPTNDPKTVISASSGVVNHHSEWNRLMCQIHEEVINSSWEHPDNIESDVGILEHSLGSGSQGMYSDVDLIVASGNGRFSWCQEMSISTSHRLGRGYHSVSHSYNNSPSSAYIYSGWRPVLRLIG